MDIPLPIGERVVGGEYKSLILRFFNSILSQRERKIMIKTYVYGRALAR
jgi:hypothetical protein